MPLERVSLGHGFEDLHERWNAVQDSFPDLLHLIIVNDGFHG
jgi:hypothetical protein